MEEIIQQIVDIRVESHKYINTMIRTSNDDKMLLSIIKDQ